MTLRALRVQTGQKVLIISETGRSPVTHDGADCFCPFDHPFVTKSGVFRVFHDFNSFVEKGCPTAGF